MSTNPFPAATITKLISTFACHVVAGLSLLNDYLALITLCKVVFYVENLGLIVCAFTLVFQVHTFFTKLVLALKALIRLILNDRNDSMTIFIWAHFQKRVIGDEIKFFHLIKKLPCLLAKRPKESTLLINIRQARLLRTLRHSKGVKFSIHILLKTNPTT